MAKTILPALLDGLATVATMSDAKQRKILAFTRMLADGTIDAKDMLGVTDDQRRQLFESLPEGIHGQGAVAVRAKRRRAPAAQKRTRAADKPNALFERLMGAMETWADDHAISRKGLRALGLQVPDRAA